MKGVASPRKLARCVLWCWVVLVVGPSATEGRTGVGSSGSTSQPTERRAVAASSQPSGVHWVLLRGEAGHVDTSTASEFHVDAHPAARRRLAADSASYRGHHRVGTDDVAQYIVQIALGVHHESVLGAIAEHTGLRHDGFLPRRAFLYVATVDQAFQLRTVPGVVWVGAFLPEHASRDVEDVVAASHRADLHNDGLLAASGAVPSNAHTVPAALLVTVATSVGSGGSHGAPHEPVVVLTPAGAAVLRWSHRWPGQVECAAVSATLVRVSVPRRASTDAGRGKHTAFMQRLVVALREDPLVRWVDAAAPVPRALTKWARWNTQGMELADSSLDGAYGVCPAGCEGKSGSCLPQCNVAACKFDPLDCHNDLPTSPYTAAGLDGTGE